MNKIIRDNIGGGQHYRPGARGLGKLANFVLSVTERTVELRIEPSVWPTVGTEEGSAEVPAENQCPFHR